MDYLSHPTLDIGHYLSLLWLKWIHVGKGAVFVRNQSIPVSWQKFVEYLFNQGLYFQKQHAVTGDDIYGSRYSFQVYKIGFTTNII